MRKLSPTQLRMLGLLARGESYDHGLHGRSEHGGAVGTLYSLVHRGLIKSATDATLTPAGEALHERENAPMSKKMFESVKQSRGMPWLLIGMTVEVDGRMGTVLGGNASANLDVQFVGDSYKSNVHPKWKTKYYVGEKLIAVDGVLVS